MTVGKISADPKSFQEYFKEIRKRYLSGDYTEFTLRTPLENFIKSISQNFNLIQEPKRTQGVGAPDFKAYRKNVKVGYVETKDLGKNLDKELDSEQVRKYRNSIDNLILTNYSRFILFRSNQIPFDFSLFSLFDLANPRFIISQEKIRQFQNLLEIFFSFDLPTITSAEELSLELSRKTKLLKELAEEQLKEDISRVKINVPASSVYDFFEGIKELLKDMSISDCADAYAQTIAYGLFLARTNDSNKINRENAALRIPPNIGVIKRIFLNISGDSLPPNLSWIVEEIVDLLNSSDIEKILTEIDFRGKKDRDPFTFFYEGFLAYYDPEKRKHLGVYYTPRPVVSFIVNSVNQILKRDFGKLNGFAEDDVTVLDPAVGTGTFLWLVYLLTLVELKNKGLSGLIKKKIENHILKDFYGFEILITPYIISHLKLTTVLKKWFYKFKGNDRIQVYLTNTLNPSETHGLMPFLREITEESKTANELKLKTQILVIVGNPPYSVSSSNKSEWIMGKMRDYKKNVDEKNIQPLDDDYIKFIRFAQWKIEQNQQGVIGFISNNSYLDGIIHRQIRKELLNAFDRIYILNLHGSSRRVEELPLDVSEDENVFDIQQGVAIVLFVKNGNFKDKKVFYSDLFGQREEKYRWLDRNSIQSVEWQELNPESPHFFFVPKDLSEMKTYERFLSLRQIFKEFNIGVATGKDSEFVSFDKERLRRRFKNQSMIKEYHYRPFDTRFVYYDTKKLQRAREKIMRHLEKDNVALVSTKFLSTGSFQHQFVTNKIADRCLVSIRTREGGYVFPLYVYSRNNLTEGNLGSKSGKWPNLTKDFIEFLGKQYPNQEIIPEDILGYIYAILHSSTYRQRFNELLKIDFPRIPFVKDFEDFKSLSQIGTELVSLHLMKSKLRTNTKFDVQGSNVVEIVKYEDGKIYINKEQNFSGISEKTWNFFIGSYPVLNKWLKSRRNRELSSSEIEQFLQITEIINQTLQWVEKIDKIDL